MTFKGAWVAGYGYAANDSVTYGSPTSTYIAQDANTSQDPVDNPSAWAVLAQAGGAGPSGPTGQAATIAIGTITTGPPGTSASVTNSGTSTTAVLNFTIPQGATGPAGSGGSGNSSGFPLASMYHAVSFNFLYYSVANPNSSATELAPILTWIPAGCTATALNVFSQQANPITVTLRSGTPGNMASTALVCAASPDTSCTVTGSVTIAAGSFVDLNITGANGTASGVWTALTCN
jgi:hypothetical protein